MLLHRNERGSQKPLNFSGSDQSYFFKESKNLTRERSTVMTIASSSNAVKTPPLSFYLKEKELELRSIYQSEQLHNGVIKAPTELKYILKYIESLSTIPIHFSPETRRVFTLDDYSAHLVLEVEEAFFKKEYFLIIIAGEITGDI